MNPNDYNLLAREAYAKSLIDVGVSIFKGIMLLCTVVPLAAVMNNIFNDSEKKVSILEVLNSVTLSNQAIIVGLLITAFILAWYLRYEGLRHLYEIQSGS
ncbi:hypothetical protein [Pseudoalteromonas ruthenica]|uniref:hypothetical protein n=1 Tax=Pseudoalteromonas ruthenica TaxID=151081 RepID=UPI00110B28BF|nr:hypothetical protein [Pseudoalteromonas ruthenica]TMO88104.1 hypothetical protein CWC12_07880 [Pseudoalteromonas ruthenica]TMP24041.1 hypothetical protein CWC06_07050 [Pseudoalteromonas ruthenica]